MIDINDLYPLTKMANFEDFVIINDFHYTPEEVFMKNMREISENSYNTYKTIGASFTYAQANLIALAGNIAMITHTAGDMLFHYLKNTGEDYKLDVGEMILTSSVSNKAYLSIVNKAYDYVSSVLKDGDSIIIMSKTIDAHVYGGLVETNWNASVGKCSGILIFEATNNNLIKYKIRYIVFDFYDWGKGSKDCFIPTVSDGEMYTLHESGYAKQYYVYGEYLDERMY